MKQQIHTMPVVEAFQSGDECPFCYLYRDADQRAIRFFAGPSASYMEPEIRKITTHTGFCEGHMKKLYDYGNRLGNALMVQSHYANILEELQSQLENYEIPKKRFFSPKKKEETPFWQHLQERTARCAVCKQVEDSMDRHYQVFFSLLKEQEFCRILEDSKGFCIPHFARLLQMAEKHLPQRKADWFYPTVYRVMEQNLVRVKEDLDWFIQKHDYRFVSADWKNSQDSLQRAMQKINSGYPADPPYRKD
jgi:hypothetical protein